MERDYSPLDRLLIRAHAAFAGPLPGEGQASRPNPAVGVEGGTLDETARRHAAGLMRVNHAGEVAAQALYLGHAVAARAPEVRAHMLEAAAEERAHLTWCEERLRELDDNPSVLDPLWYAGSFAIGALAGLAGDPWALGFVEETEKQVSEHLGGHLDSLPQDDARSRAIVEAMKRDEERHGAEAVAAGAQALPKPVQELMRGIARVMTRTAYWF